MKKRMITLGLALSLAFSLAAPAGAVVAGEDAANGSNNEIVLELEYMDFYENQDYYMSLVCDKGYTLHFDASEYQDLENARLAKVASAAGNSLIMPCGTTSPVETGKKWNIATQGTKEIAGTSNTRALYTEYYFVGSAWYVATINNHNYTNYTLKVTAFNVRSADQVTQMKSGTTIKKYTMSGTGATANITPFYLKFDAPVNVSGTIARGS